MFLRIWPHPLENHAFFIMDISSINPVELRSSRLFQTIYKAPCAKPHHSSLRCRQHTTFMALGLIYLESVLSITRWHSSPLVLRTYASIWCAGPLLPSSCHPQNLSSLYHVHGHFMPWNSSCIRRLMLPPRYPHLNSGNVHLLFSRTKRILTRVRTWALRECS